MRGVVGARAEAEGTVGAMRGALAGAMRGAVGATRAGAGSASGAMRGAVVGATRGAGVAGSESAAGAMRGAVVRGGRDERRRGRKGWSRERFGRDEAVGATESAGGAREAEAEGTVAVAWSVADTVEGVPSAGAAAGARCASSTGRYAR